MQWWRYNGGEFFFHLGLHPSAGGWIRIKTGMGDFQWTALPFGLICPPYWTGRLAQVVEKTLRHQGVHLIWYVDEILILGGSQHSVATNLEIHLQTCNGAGLIVNQTEISIYPEPTGEPPRLTDHSEDQDGGAPACKIEQGTGDDKGLPAE